MGRIIWFINGLFGSVVGLIVAIISIYWIFIEFTFEQVGLFIGGVLAFIFGVYQWKKFLASR
jgi:hypothetical protein